MIINVLFWAYPAQLCGTIAFLEKIGLFLILYNKIGLFSFFRHNVFCLHFLKEK